MSDKYNFAHVVYSRSLGIQGTSAFVKCIVSGILKDRIPTNLIYNIGISIQQSLCQIRTHTKKQYRVYKWVLASLDFAEIAV